MDFWSSRFHIDDKLTDLEVNQVDCDFCRMRWNVSKHLDRRDFVYVSFQRIGSTLRMNDGNVPAFSFFRSRGKFTPPLILTMKIERPADIPRT